MIKDQKKCKFKKCRRLFSPLRKSQKTCSISCALSYVKEKEAENFKKITRQKKNKLQSRDKNFWKKKAQKAFNQFIRERDKDENCISCGIKMTNRGHAGHYLHVGTTQSLKFDENNCHKQCSRCNLYLSGNLIYYRRNLEKKIGQKALYHLENKENINLTLQDFKDIFEKYKKKCKLLKSHYFDVVMLKAIISTIHSLPVRQSDQWGEGHYGASRGHKKHRGIDFEVKEGSLLMSPVSGQVSKLGYPYGDDLSYRYVQITDNGHYCHRFFYISPCVELDDFVETGTVLGEVQPIVRRYPKITPHVHYEIKNKNGKFIDPFQFFQENSEGPENGELNNG